MPVTDVTHDLDSRTLTITAEFAAPVERVWQIYADPRQLEKVFGPPTHPATFVEHDLTPGGRAHYFMTSPEGEKFYGWWKVTAVDEPRSFAFDDGFASDDSFTPLDDMPVSHNVYVFESVDKGTRATFTSTYDSTEALEKVLEMGVVEGASSAIDQIDTLVAA
ncbi:MAG TPA: SRPBCC domain-containing protein [Ilumatobacter sp.]|nr:SRPBCC domain-containing protein [Ilumatobacter sp.]